MRLNLRMCPNSFKFWVLARQELWVIFFLNFFIHLSRQRNRNAEVSWSRLSKLSSLNRLRKSDKVSRSIKKLQSICSFRMNLTEIFDDCVCRSGSETVKFSRTSSSWRKFCSPSQRHRSMPSAHSRAQVDSWEWSVPTWERRSSHDSCSAITLLKWLLRRLIKRLLKRMLK